MAEPQSRSPAVPDAPEVLFVAEIHHFTYGWFTPVAAFVLAYILIMVFSIELDGM